MALPSISSLKKHRNPYDTLERMLNKTTITTQRIAHRHIVGMPFVESKEVRSFAKQLDLRMDNRQSDGQPYIIIYSKVPPLKIVEHLQANNGTIGKYTLVPKASLPSHDEIIKDKLKQEESRCINQPAKQKPPPRQANPNFMPGTRSIAPLQPQGYGVNPANVGWDIEGGYRK